MFNSSCSGFNQTACPCEWCGTCQTHCWSCHTTLYFVSLPLMLLWIMIPWLYYQWCREPEEVSTHPGLLAWLQEHRHGLGAILCTLIGTILLVVNGVYLNCETSQLLFYVNWGLIVLTPLWDIGLLCLYSQSQEGRTHELLSSMALGMLLTLTVLLFLDSQFILPQVTLFISIYVAYLAKHRKWDPHPVATLVFYLLVFFLPILVPDSTMYLLWILSFPVMLDLHHDYQMFKWVFAYVAPLLYALALVIFLTTYSITLNDTWLASQTTFSLFFLMWHLYGSLYTGKLLLQSQPQTYYEG